MKVLPTLKAVIPSVLLALANSALAQGAARDVAQTIEAGPTAAEPSEVDRLAALVAENADNASSVRKMFKVDNVHVKNIRNVVPENERNVIREAVAAHQVTVDELRNAVQSNSPVFRRASEQISDISKIIAAEIADEADLVLYVDE